MKTHRVAVVGCGALARGAHLPHCQKNPRIELVATCDIDKDTAETCKTKFGAQRAQTDWREIVKADDIDLAILATHTNLRGEFIIPAIESGKPVYTEKPLAPSLEEMARIVQVSRQTGVPICVGHNRRSGPAMLEMKRLFETALTATEVDTPSVCRQTEKRIPEEHQTQMLIRVNDDIRSWKDWIFGDEQGVMFGEMVHFVDQALWFIPSDPVQVYAEGSNRGNFTMLIKFRDGSIATLQHSAVGNFDYPKELFEISTNNITIAMDQHIEIRQSGLLDEPMLTTFPFKNPSYTEEEGMTAYIKAVEQEKKRARQKGEQPRWLNVEKGHYKHLDRFLDHIEGKAENPCDIESAVIVNRITLKLLESVKSGLPVAVEQKDITI